MSTTSQPEMSVVEMSDSETGETSETKPGGEEEEDYWKVEIHPHAFKSFFQRFKSFFQRRDAFILGEFC